MITKTDKASRLRKERDQLNSALVNGQTTNPVIYAGRIAFIDKELAKLARRRDTSRLYRETMFDLNGHHGRA